MSATEQLTATVAIDGAQFRDNAQRITNGALLDEWIAMYHEDAVAEWIVEGVYMRYDGLPAIRRAATAQVGVWRSRQLRVKKQLECADSETVVVSWRGGFHGDDHQFGVEIWTLADGLVVRHQMYTFLDVRPSSSIWARIRVTIAAPRTALSALRHERSAGVVTER